MLNVSSTRGLELAGSIRVRSGSQGSGMAGNAEIGAHNFFRWGVSRAFSWTIAPTVPPSLTQSLDLDSSISTSTTTITTEESSGQSRHHHSQHESSQWTRRLRRKHHLHSPPSNPIRANQSTFFIYSMCSRNPYKRVSDFYPCISEDQRVDRC